MAMATTNAAPNVWTQMNYVPPRGQCNFKESFLAPKCPCLRFMLHPLKSGSTYDCDGCAHHASFHSMENPAEDEIRKRWEVEEKEREKEGERAIARPRKRLRELEYGNVNARAMPGGLMSIDDLESVLNGGNSNNASPSAAKAKGKRVSKGKEPVTATRGAAATRSRGKIIEIPDGQEDTLDLD